MWDVHLSEVWGPSAALPGLDGRAGTGKVCLPRVLDLAACGNTFA